LSATERKTAGQRCPSGEHEIIVSPARLESRPGLTLIELMFVTVILGIIVMIGIGPFAKARERAMVGAVKGDMRNVEGEIDRYVTVNGYWPQSANDLEEYESGPDILYCSFALNVAARAADNTISLSAIHRGSTTIVSATTPGGTMTEATGKTTSGCTARKTNKGKSKKGG
jgi:prepilin-type N-terminal cleavage/methylation domain-containing protein